MIVLRNKEFAVSKASIERAVRAGVPLTAAGLVYLGNRRWKKYIDKHSKEDPDSKKTERALIADAGLKGLFKGATAGAALGSIAGAATKGDLGRALALGAGVGGIGTGLAEAVNKRDELRRLRKEREENDNKD